MLAVGIWDVVVWGMAIFLALVLVLAALAALLALALAKQSRNELRSGGTLAFILHASERVLDRMGQKS